MVKAKYLLLTVFFLSGCGAASPADTVSEFQRLYINSDWEKLPQLMTETQQKQWESNPTLIKLNRKLSYEIKYEIAEEKTSGDSADVTVKITQRRRSSAMAGPSDKVENLRQTFQMKKSGDRWLINRIGPQEPIPKK